METEINIAREFTEFPGGRYKEHGRGSGEEFRDRFLIPALREERRIVIDLDGVSGYPSSFLEEAFGGLVREGFSREQLRGSLAFKAGPAFAIYADLAWSFINEAAEATARKPA